MTHKLEYLCHAHHIIVVESRTIKHSAPYEEIEKSDPNLFNYWTNVRQKEEEMRKKVTIEDCGTTKERHKLVRMLSNKIGCRGSVPIAIPKSKPKRRHVSFNRYSEEVFDLFSIKSLNNFDSKADKSRPVESSAMS